MVRHCKEDALTDREFELLVEGTYEMDGYFGLEARMIVLVAGRLGLRAGEIAHMEADWIDRQSKMIEIPAHVECSKGRDGGKCGYCRSCAKTHAEHSQAGYQELFSEYRSRWEDISRGEADELARREVEPRGFEETLSEMWSPKTESGVRSVPYDTQARAGMVVERYFDRFETFQASRTVINRRVTKAAEHAAELDADDIYPHALRATCAEKLAARGLDVTALTQMMGWAQFSTAEAYISGSGEATARKLRQLPG